MINLGFFLVCSLDFVARELNQIVRELHVSKQEVSRLQLKFQLPAESLKIARSGFRRWHWPVQTLSS